VGKEALLLPILTLLLLLLLLILLLLLVACLVESDYAHIEQLREV